VANVQAKEGGPGKYDSTKVPKKKTKHRETNEKPCKKLEVWCFYYLLTKMSVGIGTRTVGGVERRFKFNKTQIKKTKTERKENRVRRRGSRKTCKKIRRRSESTEKTHKIERKPSEAYVGRKKKRSGQRLVNHCPTRKEGQAKCRVYP